jgi:hypothetical protein
VGGSLGGRLSLPFCANAPTEIIIPINTATRISLSSFITICRLLASSSFTLEGEAGSCTALLSAIWMPRIPRRQTAQSVPVKKAIVVPFYPFFWPQIPFFLTTYSNDSRSVSNHFSTVSCIDRRARSYRRTVTLTLPTLLLLSKARREIVCSPAPATARSNE